MLLHPYSTSMFIYLTCWKKKKCLGLNLTFSKHGLMPCSSMGSTLERDDEDLIKQALLPESLIKEDEDDQQPYNYKHLASRVWIESKKLWHIVAPAILSRILSFSMNLITQAFVGHLGDIQPAAISIVVNFICGISFGFLVYIYSILYV